MKVPFFAQLNRTKRSPRLLTYLASTAILFNPFAQASAQEGINLDESNEQLAKYYSEHPSEAKIAQELAEMIARDQNLDNVNLGAQFNLVANEVLMGQIAVEAENAQNTAEAQINWLLQAATQPPQTMDASGGPILDAPQEISAKAISLIKTQKIPIAKCLPYSISYLDFHVCGKTIIQPSYAPLSTGFTRSYMFNIGMELQKDWLPSNYTLATSISDEFDYRFVTNQAKWSIWPPHLLPREKYFVSPFSAEDIKEKMIPGDFLTFKTNLSLQLSANYTQALNQFLVGSVSAEFYVLSGQFQVLIKRLNDNKVIVKFIRLHTHSGPTDVNVSGRIGIAPSLNLYAKLLGNNIISKQLTRITKRYFKLDKIVIGQIQNHTQNILGRSYIIDLNNKDSFTAFQSVLKNFRNHTYKRSELIWPFGNRALDRMDGAFTVSIDPLDKISIKDGADTGVTKQYEGRMALKTKQDSWGIHLGLFGYDSRNSFIKNAVEILKSAVDMSEFPRQFLTSEWESWVKSKSLIIKNERSVMRTANAIYAWNPEKKQYEFYDIGFKQNRFELQFNRDEVEDLMVYLQMILPSSVYKSIKWGEFAGPDGRPANKSFRIVRVSFAYYMNELGRAQSLVEILKYLSKKFKNGRQIYLDEVLNNPSLMAEAKKYIEEKIDATALAMRDKMKAANSLDNEKADSFYAAYVRNKEDISSKLLASYFAKTSMDSIQAFESLREISTFVSHGPGFLFSLLPEDNLEKYIYFKFEANANGMKNIATGRFGENKNVPYYEEIQCNKNIAFDDSPDLRFSCLDEKYSTY